MKSSIALKTQVFDLDWNRHVTSRTYERFSQAGRHSLLHENGFPIKYFIDNGVFLIPESSSIRFLAQQFSGANLTVFTEATPAKDGRIFWEHKIEGEDKKLACEIKLITKTEDKKANSIQLFNSEVSIPTKENILLEKFTNTCKRLNNEYPLLYCDLNGFWTYSPDVIWKAFEEGRWLFFTKIIDIERITALDTTSFFMGGIIQFFRLPVAGEKLKIFTWIDRVEKIRFYIRQDLVDNNGELVASMRDEQLFVSILNSRPKKAPEKFLEIVGDYLEYA